MKVVEWHIYKRTIGARWPGDAWDQAPTLRKAEVLLRTLYDDNFHIVRVTYEPAEKSK